MRGLSAPGRYGVCWTGSRRAFQCRPRSRSTRFDHFMHHEERREHRMSTRWMVGAVTSQLAAAGAAPRPTPG